MKPILKECRKVLQIYIHKNSPLESGVATNVECVSMMSAPNKKSTLTFHGGAGTVTGANFLLNTGKKNVLIDCGMVQGGHYAEEANYQDFPYSPADIDVLIVTHAHADHIGRIPKLVKDGFKGVIYSTPATYDLARVMFDDAVRIIALEAREHGHDPLYESEHIEQAFSLWETNDYYESFAIGDGVSVRFLNAGHILGSAMVECTRDGKVFVLSGDLGNSPAPLMPDTDVVKSAHYLLVESVYGDRAHENREDRVGLLRDALLDTHKRKGTLLIPAFAIQRTQLLLYEINKLVESGQVPEMHVYLDSPLAARVTDVYRSYTHLFNERVQKEMQEGDDIFAFPKFTTIEDAKESQKLLNAPKPKVIIAGSGMSVGGRVLMHEKRLLGDKNTTILFVGYQGVGTLGRRIQDGAPTVQIDRKKVRVRAGIATIRGFSAHKDRDGLVDFVEHAAQGGQLKEVFVAMGEPKSSLFLVQRLRDFLGVNATAPEQGETVHMEF